MSRVAYQIRVTGELPERFFEDFSRVTVAVDPVGTTLRADLTDQAELNGLLDALRRDGLVLLEVRREQVFDADDQEEAVDGGGAEDAPPTTW
jgi:hypothetical protein